MFFNTVYKLPIWKNLDKKSRNIRFLIFGSILYIIVHSFINSNYVNDIEIIQNYKHYLYYLILTDLCVVSMRMALSDDNLPKKKKQKKIQKNKNLLQFNPQYLALLKQQSDLLKQQQNPPKQQIQPDIDIPIYGQQPDIISNDTIPIYSP